MKNEIIGYVKQSDLFELNQLGSEQITETDLIDHPFFKCLVARINQTIVGFVSFHIMYEKAEVTQVFVREQDRSRQVASHLLERMLELLRNCDQITLEVRVHNEIAIHLYQKYGFQIVAKREHYYGSEDGYLLCLERR